MHELSVMMEVIRIVDETAKENDLTTLKAVVLKASSAALRSIWVLSP